MASTGIVTLQQLRDRSRFRAMSGDGAVTDDELDPIINERIRRLYGVRTAKNPEDYAVKSAALLVVNGAVTVPDDFFRSVRVTASTDQQNWALLRRFMLQEEVLSGTGTFGRVRYQLRGRQVVLSPAPSAPTYVQLLYIPLLPDLVNETDSQDFVNGWEATVIADVAVQLIIRENGDPSALQRERDRVYDQLESETDNRDAGQPMHVVDVYGWE